MCWLAKEWRLSLPCDSINVRASKPDLQALPDLFSSQAESFWLIVLDLD
jgi:hypothetical protein